MKIYDKEIYQREQIMQTTIIIVVAFVIGFLIGFMANRFDKQDQINALEQNVYVLQKQLNTL